MMRSANWLRWSPASTTRTRGWQLARVPVVSTDCKAAVRHVGQEPGLELERRVGNVELDQDLGIADAHRFGHLQGPHVQPFEEDAAHVLAGQLADPALRVGVVVDRGAAADDPVPVGVEVVLLAVEAQGPLVHRGDAEDRLVLQRGPALRLARPDVGGLDDEPRDRPVWQRHVHAGRRVLGRRLVALAVGAIPGDETGHES